jgi:uncharacterized membrane protein YfcA
MTLDAHTIIMIAAAGLFAGVQNALAGGGSFITFPALLLAGLNPLAANMTSTIAMFPSQTTTAYAGRKLAGDVGTLRFRDLFIISIVGGIAGALLLLHTPASFFAKLVPWLVLFATSVFAWGSFRRKPLHAASSMPRWVLVLVQTCISIYGGYFGGGIGFLMLAALTVAGLPVRPAAATKNVLAATMNASAVAIFVFSRDVHWLHAAVLGGGAIVGGLIGAQLLTRVNERWLRVGVIALGGALSIGLFLRGH